MAITLYDLCGADPARRFSPYCWRTRLALAQKGLATETIPWRFTDRDETSDHAPCRAAVLRSCRLTLRSAADLRWVADGSSRLDRGRQCALARRHSQAVR